MSTCLAIFPVQNKQQFLEGIANCWERLDFKPEDSLFDQIGEPGDRGARVRTYELPPIIRAYFYGEDERGPADRERLREFVYTSAGELARLDMAQSSSVYNKAIMAYVKALDQDMPIVLDFQQ